MSFIATAFTVATSVVLADRAADRQEAANEDAQRAGDLQSLDNALANQQLAIENSEILRSIGGLNAAQIREVGIMNRDFILDARDRNVRLMRIEQKEDLRRHINDEVDSAGLIRVGYAASNISTSSGSALGVKIAEMKKARVDREYMDMVANETIDNFFMTETQRAQIVDRESELAAEAALFNAEAEATILQAEAQVAVDNARRNAEESGATGSSGNAQSGSTRASQEVN